eukprot:gene17007-biopygen8297
MCTGDLPGTRALHEDGGPSKKTGARGVGASRAYIWIMWTGDFRSVCPKSVLVGFPAVLPSTKSKWPPCTYVHICARGESPFSRPRGPPCTYVYMYVGQLVAIFENMRTGALR